MRETATRESRRNLKFPASYLPLTLRKEYTIEEWENIQKGFVPKQMEDKWFIFVNLRSCFLFVAGLETAYTLLIL